MPHPILFRSQNKHRLVFNIKFPIVWEKGEGKGSSEEEFDYKSTLRFLTKATGYFLVKYLCFGPPFSQDTMFSYLAKYEYGYN